jgi:2-polyprenyl-3-methyl-5-hydroxy-6-metoxy-1,4-benzoquinol methylase
VSYESFKDQDAQVSIESMQDFYTASLEYYDELFPFDEQAISFIRGIQESIYKNYQEEARPMCRYLGIGCATGTLENKLVNIGMDVTGIDKNQAMIETAKRRMKRGFSTIRFFEMSIIDMGRFLKSQSFHIIGCLDNMLPYISDPTLLRKFFYDARELLVPGGKLIIQTMNYDDMRIAKPIRLPEKSSVRVKLTQGYLPADDGQVILDATIELGNGKKLTLQRTTTVLPLTTGTIESFAREAGFSSTTLYGSFSKAPWAPDSASSIIVLGC